MATKNKSKLLIRQPKTQKAVATKESLLEATTQILLKEGVEGVNTNKIAEKAGVSIGTLYQYYASKEEILLDLIEECIDLRVQRIKKSLDLQMALLPIEKTVGQLVEALFATDSHREAEIEMHLFPYVALGHPALSKKFLFQVDEVLRPLVKALLAVRYPRLLKRNLDVIVFMLSQSVRGNVIGVAIDKEQKKNIEDLKQELVRMICGYLKS